MIGRTLSHFELCEKLGEGGMGVVYKARDSRLDRMVAIKVLSAEAVSNQDRKLRFVKEAQAASALNHPNIVTVYEIDATGETAFIAMEYIEGRTLDRLIPGNGMHYWEALPYAVQIADALAAAHAAGIVHRDLKPANIMITGNGLLKVLDFGLAKLLERGSVQNSSPAGEPGATVTMRAPQTEEGTIVGTFAYMSPEQAQGKRVDARSDVFSFGAVLYEMLTGHRAFAGDTTVSTLAAILDREPKPVAQSQAVPKELETTLARCLRKAPERRFQVMADVKLALQELQEEFESGKSRGGLPAPAKRTVGLRAFAIAVVALSLLLGLAAYGFWWKGGLKKPAAREELFIRLTSDSGLTTDPAISLDGKTIAYASDRSGRGDLDIWVQQTGGGAPIRVTSEEADEHEPGFSPDGNTIAFRSEREKGGIYVVSTLGGEARLIAKDGHDPCFSPDGMKIAYWTGAGVGVSTPSQIYVVPAAGGGVTAAQSELKYARHPVWTPDGKRLLFWGSDDKFRPGWWTVEINAEGVPASNSLSRAGSSGDQGSSGFSADPFSAYPMGWFAGRLVVTVSSAHNTDLWTVPVSHENWGANGAPQRLTSGVELAAHPSASAGNRLAFASLHSEINVWSLPADGNSGRVTGGLQQLTYGVAQKNRPVVSRDGKKLAFVLVESPAALMSSGSIVVKDLGTAKETTVALAPALYPSLSADGSRMAYSRLKSRDKIYNVEIHVADLNGAAAEKVCDACGLTPASWSSDGSKLLYDLGSPQHVGLFDLVTRANVALLRSADRAFTQASFSPDDQWICFLGGLAPGRNRVYIMPFRQGAPAPPESDWIAVTEGTALEGLPRWSPDGNLVYFVSDRDGFRCLWAQRLDGSRKPAGPSFAVSHFHQARRSLSNVGTIGLVGLGVATDKIVFNLGELTGNIWMVQVSGSK